MLKNYTVIYSHPGGATATFIYEDGELSSLAKGLDTEQFWVFKQVKAYLLRNDEIDIAIASDMMAKMGFSSHIMNPLPDLLASPTAHDQSVSSDEAVQVFFRHIPEVVLEEPTSLGIDEIHWREKHPSNDVPPHKAPPVKVAAVLRGHSVDNGAAPATQIDEIHWHE